MVYTENALNILAAKTFKGIGRAWIVKNLNDNKDEKAIISLLNNVAKEDYQVTLSDFEEKKTIIKNIIKKLDGFMDGVVAIGDANFPPHRGNVKNSEQPIFIFYRGNLSLLNVNNKNIAVIGLLNPDDNIEKIEKEVVEELVKNNVTIVSGLALGCDTIAHKQSLQSKGKTVAILPSPLNNIMPATNKDLAKEILEKDGLLLTEYLTDAKSKMELGSRYQERDRLQALFSDSIILSASYSKNNQGKDSGSRLAMGYAFNYSIQRAVIYNPEIDFNNPKYDLNRQCIKEEKDIIVINQSNLIDSVKKIVSKSAFTEKNQPIQQNLFD
ncbi:DNA-processing protein DprA [Labilibaculum sp.]|uniref:DNA-processing protein DprA n=1 Tax=Labilibaculum sp. TaxID=2060723 RepID=UPI002AA8461E|nr:DNA-processing protein DprA [Labilibaculum sp.]|eukprot:TRINITY_DN32924_c0_g1_i1.p1 TRINITY_DN32924_c0_g1~~TRINITY_DN32924_c0_g1_i1.p1  ORF type:complete len:326 (-),score=-41.79 TRINITY_DN32924_c0_g1_i1:123-1100(-)